MSTIPTPLFPTGKVIGTRGFIALFPDQLAASKFVLEHMARHVSGDWGHVSAHDAQANNAAITSGDRILSVYIHKSDIGRQSVVWVMTEADRSVTTFLLPE